MSMQGLGVPAKQEVLRVLLLGNGSGACLAGRGFMEAMESSDYDNRDFDYVVERMQRRKVVQGQLREQCSLAGHEAQFPNLALSFG